MREASARTRPPSWEIGCYGRSGVAATVPGEPLGGVEEFRQTARTALPTHDPASVLPAGAPEPPRALRAPPWLAPSTSMAGGAVVTRVRLPTVAECAELLAGGWTPVLGRLGVWVDDSGDSRAMWWTWALEIARHSAARSGVCRE